MGFGFGYKIHFWEFYGFYAKLKSQSTDLNPKKNTFLYGYDGLF